MELFVFARFHAKPDRAEAVAQAISKVLPFTGDEPACLSIQAFRSVRDPDLFWIHSRWREEKMFERHATLPHTLAFLATVEPLIDHPLEVSRTRLL